MKLKDIKVGMEVADKYDNEYIVEKIDKTEPQNKLILPIKLKSIKVLKNINVSGLSAMFSRDGQSLWIYKSKKVARREGFHEENIITVKLLKLKNK